MSFAIDRINEQREIDRHWQDLTEGKSPADFGTHPYAGHNVYTDLPYAGGEVLIRASVQDGETYIELRDCTSKRAPVHVIGWGVRLGNGQHVPGWVSMPDSNLILIERPADVEWIDIDILARLKDGTDAIIPARINLISGEILIMGNAERHASASVQFTEQLAELRDAPGREARSLFNALNS